MYRCALGDVVVAALLFCVVQGLPLCPQVMSLAASTSVVSPQVVALAGATVPIAASFSLSLFPPPSPLTSWPLNVTGGIILSASVGDTGDGLRSALASPRGFVRYYAPYLLQAGNDYAVSVTANNMTDLKLTVTVLIQPCPLLTIAVPEIISVSLEPIFFGLNVVNASFSPLCREPSLMGSIVVQRTPPQSVFDATLLFAEVTTLAAVIATGALGLGGTPCAGVDAQSMLLLGTTACSSSNERYALRSLRGLTPLAADETAGGMLWGTAVGLGCAWAVWLLALFLVKNVRSGSLSWQDAAVVVRFPAYPFAITTVLFQGVSFVAVRSFVHGIGIDNYSDAAGGLIGAGLLMAVLPAIIVFYAHLGISAQLVERQPSGDEDIVSRLLWPNVFWRPASAARAAGYVFCDLSTPRRWMSAFPFASAIAMAIVGGVEPTTTAGCAVQFSCLAAVQGLFAVLTTIAAPSRLTSMCSLRIATHVAIAAAAAVIAVSLNNESETPVGFVVPVCMCFSLIWARLLVGFGCDVVEWKRNEHVAAVVGVLWWDDPAKRRMPVTQPPPLPPPPPPPPLQLQADPAAAAPELQPLPAAGEDLDDLDKMLDALDREAAAAAEGDADGDDFFDDLLADAEDGSKQAKSSKLRDFTSSKILRATRVLDNIKSTKAEREQFEMFGDVHAAKPDFLRGGSRSSAVGRPNDLGSSAAVGNKLAEMLSNMKPRDDLPKPTNPSTAAAAAAAGPGSVALAALPYKLLPDGESGDASRDYIVVFRVEIGQLRRQPAKDFGKFHEGDAYVVECHKAPSSKKDAAGGSYELFAWIGKLSTPDEMDAAVLQAVERDEQIESDFHPLTFSGGYPITRLFQGRETSAFLGLFPGHAIQIVEGGIDNVGAAQPMLFHVHGTTMRETAVTPVPPTLESLDEGDVFILDTGTILYVFQGTGCSPMERMAAARYAMDISVTRTACRVVVISTADSPDEFWERLGTTRSEATKKPIQRAEALHPSEAPRLFAVDRNRRGFELVAEGTSNVRQYEPKPECSYVFDICHAVFVWVGRENASYVMARSHALEDGGNYLRQLSEPYVPLTRVIEGFEGQRFAELVGR